MWEKLLFICENGALVKRGGEIVYLNPIPVSLVKDALDAVRGAGGLFPILWSRSFPAPEPRIPAA